MEYGQFVKILEGENLNRKETVEQLKEIIQQYPYFQTAHILLAKALHEQNNIDFGRALKLAAVYAGDRTILHDYINRKPASPIEELFTVRPLIEIEKNEIQEEVFETKTPEPVTPVSTFIPKKEEEKYKEYFSEEEILGIDEEEELEKNQKIYDPHDLIRKRLSEILGAPQSMETEKEKASVKEEIAPPIVQSSIAEPETKAEKNSEEEIMSEPTVPMSPVAENISYKEDIISQEAAKADDVLSKMEVEYAMESSILDSLEKLPPIKKEKEEKKPEVRVERTKEIPAAKTDTTSPRSFNEWLKSISPKPFHNYEEVHSPPYQKQSEAADVEDDEIEEQDSVSKDELIDKFIEAEPRIVPSKTEFYSPVNQAKKSIMEHDDVVSETLAKIYRQQGNLDKARWCYQRLMLLHPEKSAFFAALLKEIDEINKEDL